MNVRHRLFFSLRATYSIVFFRIKGKGEKGAIRLLDMLTGSFLAFVFLKSGTFPVPRLLRRGRRIPAVGC